MADPVQAQLGPLRERIDAIDAQILDLLNQRAQVAQQVGEVKHALGGADVAVLRPEREAQVIRSLQARNTGPFPAEAVRAVWTEVMSACRGLERGLTVAYLGPQGTYSEQVALAHFGHAVTALPCVTIDEVFRAVESNRADVGMVPVENSTEGAVNRTLDLLLSSPVRILGENSLVVRHCLMTRSGTLEGVTRVMAHPQALAQCQGWLTQHAAGIPREAVSSNAEAARIAAEDPTVAAIASESAASLWQIQVVAASIQDDPHNRTRFLAIGHQDTLPSGRDKTSIILAVPNTAGAVYQMLTPLAQNGVSMTRFESRPARTGQWEYYFYVDVQGHRSDANVAKAFDTLQAQTAFFKLLGSYPAQP
ncbi:prephenate dehydratase [Achromobacter sp. GG226]|uniref:prephenate dehydratase n=1 Tax=Verticiella alkaliphila TaxID=2779529 RepID=UPI001C0CEF7E|nr:prephenate dehydratase [Verticiella sp. GG226]MBU4609334.1 prephenate dehydratase [Verticiella sp. GG226]